jgi:23S rRNA (uracil-5-)-methyltransferase RumA
MTEPRCRYFLKCGGCSAQHIEYNVQVSNKQKMVADAVGVDVDEVAVFSGSEYGYRNRMDFIFHGAGIGFRRKGDWRSVVDVDRCEISNARLNEIAGEIREFFVSGSVDAFDVRRKAGTFRYAVVRTPSGGSSVSFVLNAKSSKIAEAIEKVKEFAGKSPVENIVVTYVEPNTDTSISDDYFVVKGGELLREKYMGNSFVFPVQGFFQNNHEVAEKMHEYVNGLLKGYDTKGACLLDLYAGVGTFGINNALLFEKVNLVEGVAPAVDAAKKNIEINKLRNVVADCVDDRQLKKLEFGERLFVVTDPPRSGMNPKTVKQLNRLEPEVIVYVSCNPRQLAKDIPKFRQHEVKSVAMFDMFPQTVHCEAVVELVRKG